MNNNSNNIILLKRDEYDPFIDFLKGICIVLVILTHCIPYTIKRDLFFYLWGKPAVPIFLIIQVFHAYKKGVNHVKRANYEKLWQRIIKPFIIAQVFLFFSIICMKIATGNLDNISHLIKSTLKYGGNGSGSYYPWIYIQFAVILPFFACFFQKMKGFVLAVVFIIISIFLEMICNIVSMPIFMYRLLFFRYTMLIYLGYLLATKGYSLNLKTFLLSILSVFSVLIFEYTNYTFSLFIYSAPSWNSCHWICYFYIAFFLFFIFYYLYQRIGRHIKICGYVKKMGIYSYEIFLFQMIYFDFHKYVVKFFLWLIGNSIITYMFTIIISVVICVVPVVTYKDYQAYKQQQRSW